jgi:hypothetical protein
VAGIIANFWREL